MFNYFPPNTGSVQQFVAPITGIYRVQCWGASGGSASSLIAGLGGYVSGNISFDKNKTIYLFIGGYGLTTTVNNNEKISGGYNGGGACYGCAAGGGGATDIRLIGGSWNDFNSLKSRIMVAGGGGGENNYSQTDGLQIRCGCGGNLQGGTAISRHSNVIMLGATQTSGGITNQYPTNNYPMANNGIFGCGGTGATNYGGGGGGGYYGGAGGCNEPQTSLGSGGGGEMPGSGGSSFISGYTGCNAISESSISTNILHTGSSKHYSGYVFNNCTMISGDNSMPSPTGSTEIGNGGNGYCIITYIP